MVGFRFHRGGLKEAMETYQEFNSLNELFDFLIHYIATNFIAKCGLGDFYIDLYGSSFSNRLGADDRINWDNTFIVGFKNIGVLGFMTILSNEEKKDNAGSF